MSISLRFSTVRRLYAETRKFYRRLFGLIVEQRGDDVFFLPTPPSLNPTDFRQTSDILLNDFTLLEKIYHGKGYVKDSDGEVPMDLLELHINYTMTIHGQFGMIYLRWLRAALLGDFPREFPKGIVFRMPKPLNDIDLTTIYRVLRYNDDKNGHDELSTNFANCIHTYLSEVQKHVTTIANKYNTGPGSDPTNDVMKMFSEINLSKMVDTISGNIQQSHEQGLDPEKIFTGAVTSATESIGVEEGISNQLNQILSMVTGSEEVKKMFGKIRESQNAPKSEE